ncbi:MAG: SlyX family protein [Gammaproteobacteria bacterium]|nr:SlyX family protein [Gammaproteobacteria bacterium]
MIELETKTAFQEETIEQLNQVVTRQQQQIDLLQRQLTALKTQVQNFQPSMIATHLGEAPPPHY